MLEALIRGLPPRLKELKTAVVMGGTSPEREVSLRSGARVLAALERLGLPVLGMEFDRHLAQRLVVEQVSLAFLAVHGVPGEDGSLQGLLEGLGIAYTGAGVNGSALAINKLASKALLDRAGLAMPRWRPVEHDRPLEVVAHDLARDIRFPMVLKPVFGGSSLGVRLANHISELRTALELLLPQYPDLFAEAHVKGREITVSILEDSRGAPYALPILELQPKNLFYDYECKTRQGMTDFLVPADLPKAAARRAVDNAISAHRLLDQRDFSRSDFILSETGEVSYLETNSIPGLTELSDLPAQAAAYGMSFEECVVSALRGALRRLR